ncbi:enoyl-CoA hydratase [Rhodococcus rhodochrous]|nr:enoyl-CoA hydratase [Rhodococcus rhodochrous]
MELVNHGSVRQLRLNAPERLNALDRGMLDEMAAAVATVAADTQASALVVSGAGRAFCAGADVGNLFGDTTRPPAVIRDELKTVYASFLGLRNLTIPTICAVQGAAVGAGINIALACDIVVAGPKGSFVVSFADIGLHPGGGCSWFLTRLLGPSRAMATILGGETIGADEAYRLGLVAELAEDPEKRALELAECYSIRDLAMLEDMKRAVQLAREGDLSSVLEFESWAQASSVTKPAFQKFVAEFGR